MNIKGLSVLGLYLSGNANNGTNAGLAYSNSNNTASNTNANIGSHLCYNNERRPRLLAKNRLCETSVGSESEGAQTSSREMKRVNNIFERICSLDNLQAADERARKRKQYSYGVRLHDKRREKNLKELSEKMLKGEYRTSEYSVFTIHEPKEREIYRLPYYPDRIVHHAIMNVLEPIWVGTFIKNTYSCIKDRGIHKAVNDVKDALRSDADGTRYCLKIDIRKFYPSIDHDVLKGIIRKKIKDVRLLAMLDEIIDSAEGVPIGNYLSQFFANLYLSYFDHWVKEGARVKHYFRYADDMVFFGEDKESLHRLLDEVKTQLAELKLQVKDNWQVFPTVARGIDFLGYVFFHDHTRLRKSIKKRMFRKVGRVRILSESQKHQAMASWIGWLQYCNSKRLKVKLNKRLKYEIFNTADSTKVRQ